MTNRLAPVVLLACLLQSACIYRLDIQQGNVVTREMVEQLELGMDKRQVRFLLGTPLVADTFHQDRWDYIYSYQPGGGKRVQQRVSLFFRDDRLAEVDAELDPELDLHTVVEARDTVITVPPRKPGFFAALAGGGTAAADAAAAAPEGEPETAREAEEAARLGREIDEGSRRGAAATESAAAAPEPVATPGALDGIQQVAPEPVEGVSNIGRDIERDLGEKPAPDTPAAPAPPETEAGTGEQAIKPTETYAPNVAGTQGSTPAPREVRAADTASGADTAQRASSTDDKTFLETLFQGYGTREPGSPQPVRD